MRTLFDKTRQRLDARSAPRRGENRPEAIRINPTLSASKTKMGPNGAHFALQAEGQG